jgi:ATP-dependent DNA ligase
VSKRLGSPYRSGRSRHWVKTKNPAAPAVKRASYSAGRDIEAKLISEPSTGTKLDIAATDQIRPIATTTAIPTIHARICMPSMSR